MKVRVVITFLAVLILAVGCRTTDYSSVKHAGVKLKVCGEGESDDMLSTVATDFTYESAVSVAKEKFFDDRGIESELRGEIPLELLDVCGNDVNRSYTVRMGLKHEKLMAQYVKAKEAYDEAIGVVEGREDDLDPDEYRILAKAAYFAKSWQALREALMRKVVSLPRIDARAIIGILNKVNSHTHVVLKYDKNVDEQIRSLYRRGLTALGFSVVDHKYMAALPDFVLTIASRYRTLPLVVGQFQYVYLTSSAKVTDSSGTAVGEINWKLKGGGRDTSSAFYNAREKLRKKIERELLYSMFSN